MSPLSDEKVVVLYPDEDGAPLRTLEGPGPYKDPNEVLASAQGKLCEVVILGMTHGGDPLIFMSHGISRAMAFTELCKQEMADIMRVEMGWLDGPGDLA